MNRLWRERFETELNKIKRKASPRKVAPNSTRRWQNVQAAPFRNTPLSQNTMPQTTLETPRSPKRCYEQRGRLKDLSSLEAGHGVYFLRTSVESLDEKTTWDYYNLIREIECTNKQLKNDLNLRPIYHQTDARCDAHLFFGLLTYWVVNTIRCGLK